MLACYTFDKDKNNKNSWESLQHEKKRQKTRDYKNKTKNASCKKKNKNKQGGHTITSTKERPIPATVP